MIRSVSLTFFLLLAPFLYGISQSSNFAGTWEGSLDAGVKIRFVFAISEDGRGGLKTIAESPDQSNDRYPCESTTVDENGITITMTGLGAYFKGKLENDTLLKGEFSQGRTFPLVLQKKRLRSGKEGRPQTPQPPFPYKSYEVEYDNAEKTAHFAGTLTIPDSSQPGMIPVAIIISGSGAQDRNGTLMGHQPYFVLADYLSRHGIAVLRVDDRGVGKSTALKYDVTTADYANDVAAGIEYLKTRKDIDKKKIGLIGHSEGGIIAPMVAAKRKDIAWIVLWGAPVTGGKRINTEQNAYQLSKAGIDSTAVSAFKQLHEKALAQFAAAKDSISLSALIQPVWEEWKASQPATVQQALYVTDNSIVARDVYSLYFSLYKISWLRFFIIYDPVTDLSRVKIPVLAINGSKDTQVDAIANLGLIESILSHNNKDYATYLLPSLNHLLQTAVTGDVNEYSQLQETIAPIALELITDWIRKRK